jgi:hypothetical protein
MALTSCYQGGSTAGGVGTGGYVYHYDDGTSYGCVDSANACITGQTAAQGTNYSTIWGAGIGINVNQANGASAKSTVTPTSTTGLAYAVSPSTLPTQGLRIVLSGGTVDYCAKITTASGTVPWTSFTTDCWDTPPDGGVYSGTGAFSSVEFQVPAVAAAGSFSFCVDSVSF